MATVFLSAAEASADLHGAGVARELRRSGPPLRLIGVGGDRMAAAGVELVAGLDQLSLMGVGEVLRELPRLWRLRRRLRRVLLRPGAVDLFLPIDSPALHLSLAEAARERGIAVLYYIVPQVWAWREGRARRLARACDLACAILPFEPQLLRGYGVDARFVGHPLLDGGASWGSRSTDRGGSGSPTLALFPGSRPHEVTRMLPVFADAARRVQEARPGTRVLVAAAPAAPRSLYGERPPGPLVDARAARAAATAAITKSGTVTLELALAGVPMVVGHRVGRLTYRIARRLVRLDHIALVNLVAGRRLVPELVQDAATAEALAEAVLPLLDATPMRRETRETLAGIRGRLGTPGAARRVAGHARSLLAARAG